MMKMHDTRYRRMMAFQTYTSIVAIEETQTKIIIQISKFKIQNKPF